MAISPFDYVSPFAQQGGGPFAQIAQGIQTGAALAEMDQRRAQIAAQTLLAEQKAETERAALQRQKDYQTRLSQVLANPNRTGADWESVLASAPDKDQIDVVRSLAERSDKRVLENRKLFSGNVLLALEADPEVAKRELDTALEAESDPQRRQTLQLARNAVDISPQRAAEMIEYAGAMEFGKDWIDNIAKVREQRQKAAVAPFNIRAAEAEAKKAEADVAAAQIKLSRLDAIQEAELRKARGEADAALIRAKFAAQREQAELALKDAQTKAQKATTAKTEFETQEFKRKADEGPTPVYNAQAGGFVVAPTKANPRGGFIPLNSVADAQQQQAAVRALQTAGYDPNTGEDNISKLIARSTSGGIQALTVEALKKIGVSTTGSQAISELAAAASAITLDLLEGKLGAGISNTDREFVLQKLGDIANPSKPAEDRLAGWISAKNRMIVSGMLPPPGKSQPAPPAGAASPYSNMSDDDLLRQLGLPPKGR